LSNEQTSVQLRAASESIIQPQAWGRLEWYVSAEIGNSQTMTIGKCVIDPGQANGRHLHPNCDEVLLVLSGEIIHSWNETEVMMRQGDVITIPSGVAHNARNIGAEAAELSISFSSARRTTEPAD
jgi:quercetin dioxygenase-like cupin family protein